MLSFLLQLAKTVPKVVGYDPKEGETKSKFRVSVHVDNLEWDRLYCHFDNLIVAGDIEAGGVLACRIPSLYPGVHKLWISENTRDLVEVGNITLTGEVVLFRRMVPFFIGIAVVVSIVFAASCFISPKSLIGSLSKKVL